jgi:hypothetical protein
VDLRARRRRIHLDDGAVVIDGVRFTSSRLSATLAAAGADRAFLVAVSAGPELEEEAQVRWRDGKPDEYFFLEVYGSAVVEHLVTMTGARLCAWADGAQTAVLPHYSPGIPSGRSRSRRAARRDPCATRRRVPLEVFESGMLRPKKSLLAVFGVTRHVDRVRPLSGSESLRRLFVRAVPVSAGRRTAVRAVFAVRAADGRGW